MSGLRDEGDGVRSNEARGVNASWLILVSLTAINTEKRVVMGLFGGEEVITRNIRSPRSFRGWAEMNGHITT
tara:strand:+ start:573 stop:788 length:216 start_codon:yes stop_codon:yes gene_type:complete